MQHIPVAPERGGAVPYAGGVPPSTPAIEQRDKQLRRDAVRNRHLVLDAAAQAFAESGLDVGYEDIARRAGVGVGTVYRRFPERAELVMTVFASRVDDVIELAASAVQQPDGWSGFRWFLEQFLTIQARDRGLREVLAGRFRGDERLVHFRERLAPAVSALLDRAKDERAVRPDIEHSDIAALMMMISAMSTPRQPELWRRYLALFLDALAAAPEGCAPLPLTAPADTEVEDLLHALRGTRSTTASG